MYDEIDFLNFHLQNKNNELDVRSLQLLNCNSELNCFGFWDVANKIDNLEKEIIAIEKLLESLYDNE